jgi:DNA-binding beta-propeller fold protein YncE
MQPSGKRFPQLLQSFVLFLAVFTCFFTPASAQIAYLTMGSNAVYRVDLSPQTITDTIPTGMNPAGVSISPEGKQKETEQSAVQPLKDWDMPGLSVMPNPFSDQTTLAFSQAPQNVRIRILDGWGKVVRNIQPGNEKYVRVETADLPRGMYWLEIRNQEGGQHLQPLVRQ